MSIFKEESIFYFKLKTGEDFIGEIIYIDNDPLGEQNITIADPMKIDLRDVEGQSALSLNRFFAFSDLNCFEIKVSDIICKMTLTKLFKEYYINSVKYNYLYVDKGVAQGVNEMNQVIERVISIDNQNFINAMKKYNIDPDSFLEQLPN